MAFTVVRTVNGTSWTYATLPAEDTVSGLAGGTRGRPSLVAIRIVSDGQVGW